MAKLVSKNTNTVLVSELKSANTFWQRFMGLMGQQQLASEAGLWISNCNSIHTCFMKFPIDCIFLDKDLKVKAVKENIKPWRMTAPVLGASSVIEVSAGIAKARGFQVGEVLNVSP